MFIFIVLLFNVVALMLCFDSWRDTGHPAMLTLWLLNAALLSGNIAVRL